MTERSTQLHATADRQISELIALTSTVEPAALRLPCPGRETLGDGTVGASMRHTADNYQRIAAFTQTSDRMSAAPSPASPAALGSFGSCAPSATGPQTTPTTARAPGNTTITARQTPSTSTPCSSSSQPPATRSAGSRS
jgi:hypothetical protein